MDFNNIPTLRYALRCVEALPGKGPEQIGIGATRLQELRDLGFVRMSGDGDSRWFLTEQGKQWLAFNR